MIWFLSVYIALSVLGMAFCLRLGGGLRAMSREDWLWAAAIALFWPIGLAALLLGMLAEAACAGVARFVRRLLP